MRRFLWLLLLMPLAASAQQTNSHGFTATLYPTDSGGASLAERADGWTMPRGTSLERPVNPSEGEWRFNTTYGCSEQYFSASINNGNAGWRCGGGVWSPPGYSSGVGTTTTSASSVTLANAFVPGGVLGYGGCITVSFTFVFTVDGTTKTWTVIWGPSPNNTTGGSGTASLYSQNTSSNTLGSTTQVRKLCNRNSTGVQDPFTATNSAASTGTGGTISAGAVNTTLPSYISFNCSVSAGSSCALKHYEYYFSGL